MKAAIKAVEEGQSISRAAHCHGIPKSTLYDCVSGRVVHGINQGPRPYLSPVQSAATDKGVLRSRRVSEGCWQRFLEH